MADSIFDKIPSLTEPDAIKTVPTIVGASQDGGRVKFHLLVATTAERVVGMAEVPTNSLRRLGLRRFWHKFGTTLPAGYRVHTPVTQRTTKKRHIWPKS